eukprot:6441612-Alexandrium_andersonii.AAC.1
MATCARKTRLSVLPGAGSNAPPGDRPPSRPPAFEEAFGRPGPPEKEVPARARSVVWGVRGDCCTARRGRQ